MQPVVTGSLWWTVPFASTQAVTLDAPPVQSCLFDSADVAPAAPNAKLTIVMAIAIQVMSGALARS
jgi:hypothetical protein